MTDRFIPLGGGPGYKHKNFGKQVRVEVVGNETRLIFVGDGPMQANALANDLLEQLKKGSITIRIGGRISSITEEQL